MPSQLTYPGVYIEEISSGVRTITGVATSITAFLGRAARGPVDDPILINSFADFERRFGGLQADYPLSYAVRDFYQNGGSQAIIVRLFKAKSDTDKGINKIDVGGLKLQASNPGEWGNKLKISTDQEGITEEIAARYRSSAGKLFNLTIEDSSNGAREKIQNLSVEKNTVRSFEKVLTQESQLVRAGQKDDGNLEDFPGSVTANEASGKTGNNGNQLGQSDYEGNQNAKTGMYALEKTDLFNLLCIPPDTYEGETPQGVYQVAMKYCKDRRAMLLVDPPNSWSTDVAGLVSTPSAKLTELGLSGPDARNAAIYFPRVKQSDPLRGGRLGTFVPCGIVAGVMSRTDSDRGVWKAPAGTDAALSGIRALEVNLNNGQNGSLNPLGINCLRSFPVYGQVIWGSRTLRGADQLADEYKYVPVRRLTLFLEESLYRGTRWAVFEPNDEPLWAQLRLNIGAFMNRLFRQGAFQGRTPQDAYFVKCDSESTTQTDINLGIVNIVVGFAPLKPAEFVVIKFQQIAGQIAT
jgi:uncharacterized protein